MSTTEGGSTPAPDRVGRELGREIRSRGKRSFELLLEAHGYAASLAGDVWSFALDLGTLSRAGLSPNDLRWLLYQGLLAHAREATLPGDGHRSFQPAGARGFERASCFILTKAGIDFLRNGAACASPAQSASNGQPSCPPRSDPILPVWDEERQELRLGDQVVKRFATAAPNQELILAAFQEDGWQVRIDDPLPPQGEQDPKRRLHDTINSLNRNQRQQLIRFSGDGSGEGVRWELVV